MIIVPISLAVENQQDASLPSLYFVCIMEVIPNYGRFGEGLREAETIKGNHRLT
jgi:hypothetical protein